MLTALHMNAKEQNTDMKIPPAYAVAIFRRETYRGLLEAAEFFSSMGAEDSYDINDVVDELLGAFRLAKARHEAAGGDPDA